jgi:WD40 repeat protein
VSGLEAATLPSTQSTTPLQTILQPKSVIDIGGDVLAVALSPDETWILSAARDGTIKMWNMASGDLVRTFDGLTGPVSAIAPSPDGQHLAVASLEGKLKIWDQQGNNVSTITTSSACVTWNSDGRRLATCDDEGYYGTGLIGNAKLRVWDTATGAQLTEFTGHTRNIADAAWSPDGKRIASASDDGTVKIWLAEGGEARATFQGHRNQVSAVAWSPDGKRIASADAAFFDRTGTNTVDIRLWDAFDGSAVATLPDDTHAIFAVAFSPDSTLLASAHDGGTVVLWDVTAGRRMAILLAHKGRANAVAFSIDGSTLASAGSDGMIKLWDVTSLRD